MKLLIIRPEPGASASAARAAAAGFDPVVLPFFEIQPRDWTAPDPARFDALIITSANAVRHAGEGLRALMHLPAHVVGRNTHKSAISAGLAIASTGVQGIDAVLTAARDAGHRRLLWLAGEERTAILVPADMMIETCVVYAADRIPLPAYARDSIAACPLVALHSARAARAFAAYVDGHALFRADFVLAAFSPEIATAAGKGWRGVSAAQSPVDEALLSAARSFVTDGPDRQGRNSD